MALTKSLTPLLDASLRIFIQNWCIRYLEASGASPPRSLTLIYCIIICSGAGNQPRLCQWRKQEMPLTGVEFELIKL
ncbi:hypothetical protein BDV18DRAFT_145372 [Aspergillus unguis]